MLHQLLGRGCTSRTMSIDKLECLHGPNPANIGNEAMLPLPRRSSALKLLTQPPATRQQLSIGKFLEDRQRRRATRGVTAERAAQSTRPRSIHDLRAPGNRRQWHAASKRLRSENKIRLDPEE